MDNSLGLQVNGSEDMASAQQEGNAVIGWAQTDAASDWNKPEGDVGTNDWATGASNTWGVDTSNDSTGAAASNDWAVPSSNDWGAADEPSLDNVSDDTADKLGEDDGGSRGGGKSKGNGKSGKAGDSEGGKKGRAYVPKPVAPRAKLTEDELAERMQKIRLQNEKIKERREYVKADEEAFQTSLAAERARQEANRRLQAQINQNREQNAKRKLEKIGGREWDAGKKDGEWEKVKSGRNANLGHPDIETRQGHRGRGGKPAPPRQDKGGSNHSNLNDRYTLIPDNSTKDERTASPNLKTEDTTDNISSQTDNAVQGT